ncbi:MAG TPA: WhiB family transcriptional regulator [Aeromicrobium sp.]|nr:WhiB family transcriptional regulator [Aeromicrobium sp.]
MVNIKRLPAPIIESYEWQWEGACMGEDSAVFFSPEAERGRRRQRREDAAKQICASCPVLARCREHALTVHEPYGVWGGLTESERSAIIASQTPAAS